MYKLILCPKHLLQEFNRKTPQQYEFVYYQNKAGKKLKESFLTVRLLFSESKKEKIYIVH